MIKTISVSRFVAVKSTITFQAYGPQLPGPDWKEVGVRERYIQPKKMKTGSPKSASSGQYSQEISGPSKLSDRTVLRFIPRQVKGVQRKVLSKDK